MKRRDYRSGYLRGLGIGIVVTALILTIAGEKQETLSDDQIRARATELGMVEEPKTLVAAEKIEKAELPEQEIAPTEQESLQETAAEEEAVSVEESTTDSDAGGDEFSEEQSPENLVTEEESPVVPENDPPVEDVQEEESPEEVSITEVPAENAADEVVTVTIPGGYDSSKASRLLKEAGLVEDAEAFDRYLQDEGYSRNIRAGRHEIPAGSDWEEIAKKITGKG